MARRPTEQNHTPTASDDASESASSERSHIPAPPAPQPGGSGGLAEGQYGAGVQSPGAAPGVLSASAARAADPNAPPPPPVRRYVVVGAPDAGQSILIDGYKATFRNGKLLDDNQYDIGALLRQGLRLREIVDPEPEGAAILLDHDVHGPGIVPLA